MQCRNCEYRLWGVKGRECPECGTPFAPSQYEFVPNSIRFCCPHCNQEYYGTGPQGHLEPAEFVCVQCGQAVGMDDMVLFPATGLDEEQTRVEPLPWLNRGKIGFLRGGGGRRGWGRWAVEG